MSTITVRNLDDEVKRRIKLLAASHNRSMEAEVRAILYAAVAGGDFAKDWVDTTAAFRGEALAVPSRSAPREIDFL